MKHLAAIFSLRFLGAILGISFTICLARILGADAAGLYFQALNIAAIATILGRLGVDTAALKYTAIHSKDAHWDKVNGVYLAAVKICLPSSLISTSLMYLLSTPIALHVYKDPHVIQPIQLMSLGVVPLTLLTLHAEILKGLERTALAIITQNVGIPLISLPTFLSSCGHCSVTTAILAYLTGVALTFLVSTAFWSLSIPTKQKVATDRSILLRMGFPLLFVASMGMILGITDSMMLAYWMESSYVGIYGLIAKVVFCSGMLLVVVNSIVAPKIAAYFAGRKYAELRALLRKAIAHLSLVASLLLVIILLFAKQILGMLGTEFLAGYRAMIVLALGQFVVLATGPVSYTLMMTGCERTYRNIVVVSASMNVLLNALLIPKYHLIGAATATALSLVIKNILTLLTVYLHLAKVENAT